MLYFLERELYLIWFLGSGVGEDVSVAGVGAARVALGLTEHDTEGKRDGRRMDAGCEGGESAKNNG